MDSVAPFSNDEFGLIAKYLAPLAGPEGLGLLDDAALYTPPPGFDLVLTQDTMVEGVHFPNGHYGADTAEKLLRVNLSDLAAKGARPVGYLLSLCWPKSAPIEKWLPGFVKGLETVQDQYSFRLFGGDTVSTSGPLVVSATFLGLVPSGAMVKRSGARVGDDIWVTGHIGDAALGLKLVLGQPLGLSPKGDALWTWESAYFRPEPRLIFRKALRKYATACADVSDGLVSDSGHIAKASAVSVVIHAPDIPISTASQSWLDVKGALGLTELICGGDDYELVFCADPSARQALAMSAKQFGLVLTKIGTVEPIGKRKDRVTVLDAEGQPLKFKNSGFKHF